MFSGFDFDVIERSLPYLFREGMTFTLTLTAMAMTGGIVFGTLLAMARLSSAALFNVPAATYVNLMRSVPLVLVIFWFYFLVPWIGGWVFHKIYLLNPQGIGSVLVQLFGNAVKDGQTIQVGAFWSSVITFTLFEAAYYAEIMRAGIQSIARGQVSAGQALGLNYWQNMGHIVLPQAFRNMLPVLLTQTIILFQDTSLVYVLSITDFLGAAAKIAQRDGRLVEMYLFVAVVYFVVSYTLSYGVKHLQQRIAIIR
ncbi:MAG: ABC transporter permease subunit [Betaproteobacteria bacterium]|nr:ABC transporter permease subunit [Betaproteobacteria bacterium]